MLDATGGVFDSHLWRRVDGSIGCTATFPSREVVPCASFPEKIPTAMETRSRQGRRGGVGVARVRRWLLGGLVLLLLVVAAALGVARWKTHKFLQDLPGRLGADIKTQANGWTWSQSVKGRTLFTVHAAKAVQRQNGKTTLHDVALTLYGPVGSNRTDTMRGAEFEYDQPNGVVQAAGQVVMDLASPAQNAGGTGAASKRIQATTSGLVFLQKLGVAATDAPIHLVYGDLRADATGADYETDTGILRLRANVQMDGMQDGKPVHLRAASAELDRNSRLATLHAAEMNADGTRAAGDVIVLDAGPSGGIDTVMADGHAWIQTADGVKASGPKLIARLSPQSKPVLASMSGGVQIQGEAANGSANNVTLRFNAMGQPTTADLQGTVRVHQQSTTSTDDLSAENVVATLIQDSAKRTVLKNATATGSAVLRSVGIGDHPRSTVIRGSTLHADVERVGSRQFVSVLTGSGGTRLDEDDGQGNVRSSTGDALHVNFSPPGNKGSGGPIASAVQTGSVIVVADHAAANGKPATHTRATAIKAEYLQDGGRVTLTGSPVVTGNGMQVAAQRIDLSQASSDADATGGVTGAYLATDKPGAEPVHVTADHALVTGNGNVAEFYGAARPARMWTSTAQVEAPVLELQRQSGRMTAHAAPGSAATGTVRLLLPLSQQHGRTGTARITGSSLLYVPAEGTRQAHADVSGGVRMDSAASTLTAAEAVATFTGDRARTGMMAGNVQQILATGVVRLRQPGREGQGDRLLYTAADEQYVLSGSPKVIDSQKGTITGDTLIVHGADGGVDVAGAGQRRVQTDSDAASVPRR